MWRLRDDDDLSREDQVGVGDLRVRRFQRRQGDPKSLGDPTEGVPWLDDVGVYTRGDMDDLSREDQVEVGDLRVRRFQGPQADPKSLGDPTEGVPWLDHIGPGWRGINRDDDDLSREDQVGVGDLRVRRFQRLKADPKSLRRSH